MFYDYESGCLITSPDGDVASGYQINEKIEDLERKVRTLTRQNQELKDIIVENCLKIIVLLEYLISTKY